MKTSDNVKNVTSGKLEWLPTWEGVLMYDPEDLRLDRAIRIWHVVKHNRFGTKPVRYQLKPIIERYHGRHQLRPRCVFMFRHKGKNVKLYRAYATILAYTGFAIVDRRHWVIDHKNSLTLDDRLSNLNIVSQRVNYARSERVKVTLRLSNAERKRQREERVAWMQERKRQLMASHKDADMNDIEFELAIELQEHYGKKQDK